jgi:hypothetical protein
MNKKHSSRILYIVSVGSIFKGLVFRFVWKLILTLSIQERSL